MVSVMKKISLFGIAAVTAAIAIIALALSIPVGAQPAKIPADNINFGGALCNSSHSLVTCTSTNAQTGTTYTILSTDSGKLVTLSNGSSIAVTLPQAGTTGFGAGYGTCILNIGAGTATVTPTTSTFNLNASQVLPTGAMMCPVSDGTNYAGGVATGILLSANNTWTGTQTFGAVIGGVNAQSGTTYTLQASDCGKTVQVTNAGAITVTTFQAAVVGCSINVVQGGAGQITFANGGSATLVSAHSYTKTFAAAGATVTLSVLTNSGGSAAVFTLTGDGA